MQNINNIFKWSALVSGITAFVLVASISSIWLFIEMLVVLTDVAA